jgi:serine/threonine-protein kinase
VSTRHADERTWLGKYRLEERLGRGGMAEVWRATLVGSAGFERQVAIKRIRSHLADDREFVQMFLSEARLTAQLHHPNIVQIVELGESDGQYFIAMELVRGHDLQRVARWLAKRGPIPPGFAAYVVLEIARALAYAHALTGDDGQPLGLVHRDVSPSNVMLGLDGAVKLLDFGIAKAVAASSDVRTRSGVLKGKIGYFSPEQVRGETPTQRADQFAAGVVLHELCTGRSLFRRDSDAETLALVMQAQANAPSERNGDVPAALDAVCLRALAREPADRFADCRAMAEALEPIVHELGFSATQLSALMKEFDAEAPEARPSLETPRATTVGRKRRRRRGRRLLMGLLSVAAIGTGVTAGVLYRLAHESPSIVAPVDLGAPPDLAHAPPDLAHAPPDLARAAQALPDLAHVATPARTLPPPRRRKHGPRANEPPPAEEEAPQPEPSKPSELVDPFDKFE